MSRTLSNTLAGFGLSMMLVSFVLIADPSVDLYYGVLLCFSGLCALVSVFVFD